MSKGSPPMSASAPQMGKGSPQMSTIAPQMSWDVGAQKGGAKGKGKKGSKEQAWTNSYDSPSAQPAEQPVVTPVMSGKTPPHANIAELEPLPENAEDARARARLEEEAIRQERLVTQPLTGFAHGAQSRHPAPAPFASLVG